MDHKFNQLANAVSGFGSDDGIVLPSSEQSFPDCQFGKFPSSSNGFKFDDGIVFPSLEQAVDLDNNFAPFYNVSLEVDFPDDQDNYPVLKFINQILLEENVEAQPSTSYDPLALQAAEKAFYDVLAKNYPHSPHQPSANVDQDAESSECSTGSGSYSHHATNSSSSPSTSVAPHSNPDLDNSVESSFQNHMLHPSQKSTTNSGGKMESFANSNLISSMFTDAETILQFKRGLEEGSKFLPTVNQLVIGLDNYSLPSKLDNVSMELAAKGKEDEKGHSVSGSRGRKHQFQDNNDLDPGRRRKQSAVYEEEEVELSETLDRVLLYGDSERLLSYCNVDARLPTRRDKNLQQTGLLHRSNVGKSHAKKAAIDTEAVDLIALLISCAQSVASDDYRTATDQLKLIRHHASSTGDQYQRLAVIFANALEARLAGNGLELCLDHASKRVSATEELKAMRVYLCAPLRQTTSFFANAMIMKTASKSTQLHIVDFGISYGFQWPSFIQHLSSRPGGPPKLRITGVDLPQSGFRPAEKVEETGCRLARYCERFGVPFEYQAIATRNWETIKVEDLKLERNEVVAVNCQFSFKILPDETAGDENPRDVVLGIIRNMKPDIVVNNVLNGPYGASFFMTRFRDALFFFSAIFDCLDNNLPREDLQRMNFEQDFLGHEVMNVIACEGTARVERPETYKQWQARYIRAGFGLLPLNEDLMPELRRKVKNGYHKDFMFDEDSNWILLGWKGKIIAASSCWIPA